MRALTLKATRFGVRIPDLHGGSRRARFYAYRFVFVLLVVGGYWVLGHFLYATYRVPVGNTGVYAEGLSRLAHGHLDGYDSFIGTTLAADAGEFIGYLLVPVYALFHMAGLWFIWGASVASAVLIADALARRAGLALASRALLASGLLFNGFVISNYLTSWDFNILFVPGLLALVLLLEHDAREGWILVVAFLTALVKDEAGLLVFAWSILSMLVRRHNLRRLLDISAVGLGTFAATQEIIRHLWPGTPSQIALHFASIGGNNGLTGVAVFLMRHPGIVVTSLMAHWHYVLGVVLSSGGSLLFSPGGLAAWMVIIANTLGTGPLGSLMWHSNFEFTLLAVPFATLAMLAVLARWPKTVVALSAVWLMFTGWYTATHILSALAPTIPSQEVTALNYFTRWYDNQRIVPIVYAQNNTAAHFLRSAAGVGVDSLHQIARLAQTLHEPLVIVYDPLVQNDGAPLRWPKRIAALQAEGDLISLPAFDRDHLHVYDLRIGRFLSQTGSTILPTRLEILPWMWSQGQLTLDLPPGEFRVTEGRVSRVIGGLLEGGTIIKVPPTPYLSRITLVGNGVVVLQMIAPS